MCEFMHAHKQYFLETLLVELEVIVVEHDHAPDGPFGRLQEHTGNGLGDIDRIGSLLVACEHSDVADGPVGRVDLGHFQQTA